MSYISKSHFRIVGKSYIPAVSFRPLRRRRRPPPPPSLALDRRFSFTLLALCTLSRLHIFQCTRARAYSSLLSRARPRLEALTGVVTAHISHISRPATAVLNDWPRQASTNQPRLIPPDSHPIPSSSPTTTTTSTTTAIADNDNHPPASHFCHYPSSSSSSIHHCDRGCSRPPPATRQIQPISSADSGGVFSPQTLRTTHLDHRPTAGSESIPPIKPDTRSDIHIRLSITL